MLFKLHRHIRDPLERAVGGSLHIVVEWLSLLPTKDWEPPTIFHRRLCSHNALIVLTHIPSLSLSLCVAHSL